MYPNKTHIYSDCIIAHANTTYSIYTTYTCTSYAIHIYHTVHIYYTVYIYNTEQMNTNSTI